VTIGAVEVSMDTEYKTIVCFGDSVTLGIPHVAPEDTFPALLERRLNWFLGDAGPRVRTVNSGVGGENTVEALARFETAVAAYAPDIVTVEFGLNDIRPEPLKLVERPEFAANLRRVVDQCRALGAQVILMTPNPIIDKLHRSWGTDTYAEWGGCNGAVSAYADVVRSVAAESGTILCDVFSTFVEIAVERQFNGECSSYEDLTCLRDLISGGDGVHPTVSGQRVIAVRVYQSIIREGLLGGVGA